MKPKGINRIVVGVWDFEKGKEYFEKLLGAEFAPENSGNFAGQQRSEYGSHFCMLSPELNSYPIT